MTEERLVLADLLEKAGDGDFLRAVAEAVLQLLMESDVEGMIGAGRYERSGERTTWRNGYTIISTPRKGELLTPVRPPSSRSRSQLSSNIVERCCAAIASTAQPWVNQTITQSRGC